MFKPAYDCQQNTIAFQLAQSLKNRWLDVKYDNKNESGHAEMGGMTVKFRQHGSENSIYMKIAIDPSKIESLEAAQGLLDAIKAAIHQFT